VFVFCYYILAYIIKYLISVVDLFKVVDHEIIIETSSLSLLFLLTIEDIIYPTVSFRIINKRREDYDYLVPLHTLYKVLGRCKSPGLCKDNIHRNHSNQNTNPLLLDSFSSPIQPLIWSPQLYQSSILFYC